jgi:hypothetical protein
MDEKTGIALTKENEGPSCAIDQSCCGGPSANGVEDSCTLDPSDMPERVARWQALFGQMLGYAHEGSEAVFRFDRACALDAELQELVKLERVCCAHVVWDLKSVGDETHLTLKADEGALGALVRGFTDGFEGVV